MPVTSPPHPAAPALALPTLADRCGAGATAAIAELLLARPEHWRPHLRDLAVDRWYVPLLDTDEANAWLILWAPVSGLDLHDHDGSAATVAVLRGVLDERYVARDGHRHHRRLTVGSTTHLPEDHVHAVTNPSTRTTAASIHVYSPPLVDVSFRSVGS